MLTEADKILILNLKHQHSIYAPFADALLFRKIIDALAQPFVNLKIDKVIGIEARGFILGSPIAYKLHAGFVPIRKSGSMFHKYFPDDVYKEKFTDYSKQKKTLELAKNSDISRNDNVLIVDDWFETGKQGMAAIRLIEKARGKIVGISILLDQMTENIRKQFTQYNLYSLVFQEPGSD